MANDLQAAAVYDQPPKNVKAEDACRLLYGIGIEALAAAIAENRDGTYSRFYQKEAKQ